MKIMSLSSVPLKSKISNLPKSPGVYEFRDKQGKILYIGKATSLKDRVGSYFRGYRKGVRPRPNEESGRTPAMVAQIADIKVHETDSVLEALILEANLIKKHQPKYNIEGKDDKSFTYVIITREEFPRVLIARKTELQEFPKSDQSPALNSKIGFSLPAASQPEFLKAKLSNSSKPSFYTKYKIPYTKTFGPYISKKQLEIALKLIRKIFPYHSMKAHTEKSCLDFQIGRCPGPYAGAISREDYLKNIHGIEMILIGKKKKLLTELQKQMREYSSKSEFEKAAVVRNQIFALKHIRDIALISNDQILDTKYQIPDTRIEAYDISNIGGDYATGSMVVFAGAKPDKSQYRKFKIKTVSGIDDVAMMREILTRRFRNNWPKPDLILLDGGKGHLNMAENVVAQFGRDIPVVAVAKGPMRKKIDLYYNKKALAFREIISDNRLVERIRSEAHRFAIGYHKKLRRKNWGSLRNTN